MSIHAVSLIPVDAIVIKYGPCRQELLRRYHQVPLTGLNVFRFDLQHLLESKQRSLSTLRFLGTWEKAIVHSTHLPEAERKEELRAVQELQYELLWTWEFDDDDDLF
jgi:hypothetical protein